MNKSENSISSNSCSGSDDEDVDVDFFGLSSKQEVMIQLQSWTNFFGTLAFISVQCKFF